MDFIKPFEHIPFTQVLYNTLRACRPNYNANDYKWVIGVAVLRELEKQYDLFVINTSDKRTLKRTLYGIDVEIDHYNPYNIQLFEDITDKIAVNEKGASNG